MKKIKSLFKIIQRFYTQNISVLKEKVINIREQY